jgi:hypothetical protein
VPLRLRIHCSGHVAPDVRVVQVGEQLHQWGFHARGRFGANHQIYLAEVGPGGRAERLGRFPRPGPESLAAGKRLRLRPFRTRSCERRRSWIYTCLVVPLLPGKEDELRAFYREVDGPRQQDYDRSEQRLGITKEIAWLAPLNGGSAAVNPLNGGSAAVIYIESENFEQGFSLVVQSQDEFDLWFKQRVLDLSGLDLNNPSEMERPDLQSVYQAKLAVAT